MKVENIIIIIFVIIFFYGMFIVDEITNWYGFTFLSATLAILIILGMKLFRFIIKLSDLKYRAKMKDKENESRRKLEEREKQEKESLKEEVIGVL